MTIAERYKWACETPSDISLHVPILFEYGKRCNHITEFGVRGGVSTSAWLMSKPTTLRCYDIEQCACIPEIQRLASNAEIDFQFTRANTASVEIEETDLLFLDTLHTGEHLALEMANHNRVKFYMIFHDTTMNGWTGENGGSGLRKTLIDFLLLNLDWRIVYHTNNLNGLTVLEKCSAQS